MPIWQLQCRASYAEWFPSFPKRSAPEGKERENNDQGNSFPIWYIGEKKKIISSSIAFYLSNAQHMSTVKYKQKYFLIFLCLNKWHLLLTSGIQIFLLLRTLFVLACCPSIGSCLSNDCHTPSHVDIIRRSRSMTTGEFIFVRFLTIESISDLLVYW